MATKKQIAANRNNAKRSTGPKSAGGKKVSSRNAQTTGVYAKQVLLDDEDARAFSRCRVQMYREWQPIGPTEEFFLEELVGLMWRKTRFFRMEAALIAMHRACPGGTGGVATAYDKDSKKNRALDRLFQKEVTCDRSIEWTIKQLRELQKTRHDRSGWKHFEDEAKPASIVSVLPAVTQ